MKARWYEWRIRRVLAQRRRDVLRQAELHRFAGVQVRVSDVSDQAMMDSLLSTLLPEGRGRDQQIRLLKLLWRRPIRGFTPFRVRR